MNLGSNTGSLVNHVYSTMPAGDMPVVGSGATLLQWSDRHAATVVAVDMKTGVVTCQRDTASRTDQNGMSECQEYDYTPNPKGGKENFRINKKSGKFESVTLNPLTGRWRKNSGSGGVVFGHREEYHDFSF